MPGNDNDQNTKLSNELGPFYGTDALVKAGIQFEFASQVLAHCSSSGTSISFRAGNPPSYDAPRSAKSGNNLSKTSNHGFGKTLIPLDPVFCKLDNNRKPLLHHVKDLKKIENNLQETVQIFYTLREILEKCSKENNGDMKITNYDPVNKIITIEYQNGMGPKGFNGNFTIDLNKGKAATRQYTRPQNTPIITPSKPDELRNLSDNEYNDEMDHEFPVFYSKSKFSIQQEFKVFSRDNKPITGDWDILLIGHPPNLDPKYLETYNTFLDTKIKGTDFSEMDVLQDKTFDLWNEFKLSITTKLEKGFPTKDLTGLEKLILENELGDIMDESALLKAGCITPYELMQIVIINFAYSHPENAIYGNEPTALQDKDNNISDLIQHGAENRNPYAPSNLEGNILHVIPFGDEASFVLTTTQRQAVEFFSNVEYLKKNIIDVNERWDMSIWGKIVQKQLELGQVVSVKTKAAYSDYKSLLILDEKYRMTFSNRNIKLEGPDLKLVESQIKLNQPLPPHIKRLYNKSITPRSSFLEKPKDLLHMARNSFSGAKKIIIDDNPKPSPTNNLRP